jgi:hypothetical protein
MAPNGAPGKAMSDSTKPRIVFCHGLWFDGSRRNTVGRVLRETYYDAYRPFTLGACTAVRRYYRRRRP